MKNIEMLIINEFFDVIPKNKDGQCHGKCIIFNDKSLINGLYVNGKKSGYWVRLTDISYHEDYIEKQRKYYITHKVYFI